MEFEKLNVFFDKYQKWQVSHFSFILQLFQTFPSIHFHLFRIFLHLKTVVKIISIPRKLGKSITMVYFNHGSAVLTRLKNPGLAINHEI